MLFYLNIKISNLRDRAPRY